MRLPHPVPPLPFSLPSHPSIREVLTHPTPSGLWAFLASWRSLFDRFDEDKSGSISFDEYTNALVAFGYRLSATFVNLLYTTYDKSGEGRMSFDLFVQSCIILKRMTDVFKRYDDDRDGYITLSFEEFLTGEFTFLVYGVEMGGGCLVDWELTSGRNFAATLIRVCGTASFSRLRKFSL